MHKHVIHFTDTYTTTLFTLLHKNTTTFFTMLQTKQKQTTTLSTLPLLNTKIHTNIINFTTVYTQKKNCSHRVGIHVSLRSESCVEIQLQFFFLTRYVHVCLYVCVCVCVCVCARVRCVYACVRIPGHRGLSSLLPPCGDLPPQWPERVRDKEKLLSQKNHYYVLVA